MLKAESAGAPSPFSNVPMYLPAIVIAVGDGEAVGVDAIVGLGDGEAVAVGDGDAVGDLETVGDGDGDGDAVAVGVGEGLAVAVGVGEGDGDFETVGDGDAVGVAVAPKFVGVPVPGHVCERRIPESTPLIFASDPTCTMRIRSETRV